nr:zinc carboxypeptidase A 1-like [Danaus plexippus plexippus]
MELIYIVCLVFLYINPCTSKSYKNYTLFRGVPVTDHHLEFFKNLSDVYKATFWRSPGLVHRPVEFIIGPNKKRIFLRDAMLKGIYYTTVIEDVQRAFDSQTVKTYVRRNMESFDWTSYFRLDDIYDWLQDLSVMYPKVMHLQNLGKSVEKRDILMAKITLPVRKKRSRPKIIVEGGIHSREWVSIAFVTYFLHQVLTTVDKKESKLKSIAEEYEWYFIPVLNPDGYEYTHKKDRMYRKNMKGVDLNRNFDMHFGSVGTSSRKQDETYGGPKAFSEPETLALANFVKANSKNLKFYLAFHSYGQYMIIPYAYSKKHEGNFDEVHERGIRAAKRISKKYGTQYTVGTAYDTVGYVTSGVSGCWVKKTFSVPVFDSQVLSRRKRSTRDLSWTRYQDIDDIYEWFEQLANNYSFVSLIYAGQSFEGRNITGVRINRGSQRAIFVEGGQIGADWLSPVVTTYLVNQLVRGVDSEARDASSDFDWHIFPILNPDGHKYTQDKDRLWIKNRRINRNGTIGVDLSRNWNSLWGVSGGSFNDSHSNYVGLGPFSEKESRAISYYIDSIAPRLKFVLSMRSFGQRLLLPFAHSTEPLYNYNDTIIVGRRAMGSMAVKYNTQYIVGTSKEVHDGSTGSLADWVKHRYSVPFVATYLLRDNGTSGYALPVSQVLPSCEETYDSIMAILREAKFIRLI